VLTLFRNGSGPAAAAGASGCFVRVGDSCYCLGLDLPTADVG
jgi:hypothetical protein